MPDSFSPTRHARGEWLGIALPAIFLSLEEQCLAFALHPTKQSLRKKGEPFALLCILSK